MKEWYSRPEIAGLPRAPSRDDHVARWAKRHGVERRPLNGRDYEYRFHDFPAELKAALIERTIDSPMGREGQAIAAKLKLADEIKERSKAEKREASMAELATLPERRKAKATAVLEILQFKWTLERTTNRPQTQIVDDMIALFGAREMDISEEAYDDVGSISRSSILRWEKTFDEEGPAALGGKFGHKSDRTYQSIIDSNPEMRDLAIGMIYDNPHVDARKVHRALRARFKDDQIPSQRTINRYIKRFETEDPQLALYIKNPDAWRSKYQPAYGDAAEGIVAPNQLDEWDSTPGDVMLEGGRHSIIGCIDVAPRTVKLHVVKTSSSAGIASLIRRRIRDWGVPSTIKTDNGSDYTSKHIKRALTSLGIHQHICPPFAPERKPFIERAFRTFSHDLVELLDGFIGHNVAERKDIESRRSFADRLMTPGETLEIRMSVEKFQEFCDKWTDNIYAHTPHEGLNGRTPHQERAAYRGPIRRIENERALDILLSPAPGDGLRTVAKKGVWINKFNFVAEELGPYGGQQVLCLYDEHDAGSVYVFGGPDMEFVCIAVCRDLTGISHKDLAVAARRHNAKHLREKKKEMAAAAKRSNSSDILREIVYQHSEQAAKMKSLPNPEEVHTTEFLEAAAQAAEARDDLSRRPELRRENTEEEREGIQQLRQRRERDPLERPTTWDHDDHHYEWCTRIVQAGRAAELTAQDISFVVRFETQYNFPEGLRLPINPPAGSKAIGM